MRGGRTACSGLAYGGLGAGPVWSTTRIGCVSVLGHWRIVFRFEDGMAHDVKLIDYHEENSDAYEKPSPSWIVGAV